MDDCLSYPKVFYLHFPLVFSSTWFVTQLLEVFRTPSWEKIQCLFFQHAFIHIHVSKGSTVLVYAICVPTVSTLSMQWKVSIRNL